MRLMFVAATITTLIGIMSCGGGGDEDTPTSTEPSTFVMLGSLILTGDSGYSAFGYAKEGDHCVAEGGYSDIRAGAQVRVKDENETTIAVGSLSDGAVANLKAGTFTSYDCEFPFVVSDIPRAGFYSVEVSHRGSISYSFSEMEENNWIVTLELGH